MKRQLIFAGLAAFAFLLLAYISATMAAPQNTPLLQSGETEPNDSFAEADEVDVPGYVTGVVSNTDEVDYFAMDTEIGRQYRANLNVLHSTDDISLLMRVYDGDEESIGSSSSSVSWTAYKSSHYVRIEAVIGTTATVQSASYRLDIDRLAETPTPTATPEVTDTPTPTASPTPSPGEDSYEQNDSFDQVYTMQVQTSVTLGNATFAPAGDEDWFRFWAKDGNWYQVTTSDLNDADTYLEIYDQNNERKEKNDDGAGDYASKIKWEAKYDGYYYIRVTNKVSTTGSYDLTMEKVSGPSADPSPTPASVDSAADSCEDNSDFEYACVIPVNESKTFNLVPPLGGVDNDFFRTWVKPGFLFECVTSDLSPGVDPNMIVFSGPSWDDAIGGNDDVETGNYNSFFSYYATYEGWLYLLVGTGDRTPSDIYNSNYTLRCDMRAPGETGTPTITGTPDPQAATPTPDSQAATPTPSGPPIASPTPSENITVRPLTTPTPASVTTPAPRFVPISLLVYYDGNGDHQPGAGEGIAGISAQAYEVATNQLLAQGFTDDQGNLEFTVASSGPVRVSVPFFGFSQLVTGEGASIYLRIPPQPLPGGAP